MYPPIMDRYSKPCKEMLVAFINKANGKSFSPDSIRFGVPTLLSPDGVSQVDVSFTTDTGWSDTVVPLTYTRVDLQTQPAISPMIIHSNDFTVEAILPAIFEQYGVLLEPELLDLSSVDEDVESGTGTLLITFKPEHLLFFGTIQVYVRPSIELLGTTIRDTLALREFYVDGNVNLPPVDTVIPRGELKLNDLTGIHYTQVRQYETELRTLAPGVELIDTTVVSDILQGITGDVWYFSSVEPGPFNLSGATVIYNGLTGDVLNFTDGEYNYVIGIQLGSLCSNLTGVIKLGYKYASPGKLANQMYDNAASMPIFQ